MTLSAGSVGKDSGHAEERLPGLAEGFLQCSVPGGVNEAMWMPSWCPLQMYSRSDSVTELILGRMSPHLGAVSAGESSAVPKTSW